uniref:Uncharacterized protein n=1 Tax=Arundo donax TaxID=35708 RepID=A0A0A8Z1Z6_ARUDO
MFKVVAIIDKKYAFVHMFHRTLLSLTCSFNDPHNILS